MPPNALIKPVAAVQPPKPHPLPNPWHVPNTQGNNVVTGRPGVATGYQAPGPAAAPAAAPAPVDFWSQALTDPQYTTGASDLQTQNDAAVAALTNQWKQTGQSYQDNANAHGALFSGAAVHAQNYNDQGYADQNKALASNLLSGQHQLQANVFQRLLAQLAGGGA